MNSIFSNTFRAAVQKGVAEKKDVISGVPGQKILGSINKFRSYLKTNTGVQDSIISSLTLDADLISDKFLDSKATFEGSMADFVEVDPIIASEMVTGISDAIHEGAEAINKEGVCITDGAGKAYQFIDQRNQDIFLDDGSKILFSNSFEPNSMREAIVVEKNGKVFLNNFIQTVDFVKDGGVYTRPTTLLDIFNSISVIEGKSGDGTSLMGIVRDEWEDNVSPTIFAAIRYHAFDEYNVELPENLTILGLANRLWDIVTEQHPLPVGKGTVNSLWNILNDQIESSALNEVLLATCDAIIGGINNATAIASVILEAGRSKFKSVINFGKGIASAFNHGGIYGVACYIINYVKSMDDLTDDDGVMTFTDNEARLTPKIYLAGVFNAIYTVISSICNAIMLIFKGIFGIVFSIIGSLMSQIFKIFQYDNSATRAAMNTNGNSFMPVAPYGVLQTEFFTSSITNNDVKALLEQGETLLFCEIPGGHVYIGPGEFNDDGTVRRLRLEVHPDIADSREAMLNIYSTYRSLFGIDYTFGNTYGYLRFNRPAAYNDRVDLAYDLMDIYTYYTKDSIVDNQSDDRLSLSDDRYMRSCIMSNLTMACLWIDLTCGINLFDQYNTVAVGRRTYDQSGYNFIYPHVSTSYGPWSGLLYSDDDTMRTVDNINAGQDPVYIWDWHSGPDKRDVFPTWLNISSYIINPMTTASDLSLMHIINDFWYVDKLFLLPNNAENAILLPEYDNRSFWNNLVISAVIVSAVAIGVSVATIAARKAIQRKRSFNQARVQSLNEEFVKNPTKENYNAYRKAVRTNNMWAKVIGGTKYDYVNYWNGDPSATQSSGSTSGSVQNLLYDTGILGTAQLDKADSLSSINEANGVYANSDLSRIATLITGHPF